MVDSDDTSDTDACPPDALDCGAVTVTGVEFWVPRTELDGCILSELRRLGWDCIEPVGDHPCTRVAFLEDARTLDVAPFCLEGRYDPAVFDPDLPADVAPVCDVETRKVAQLWFGEGFLEESPDLYLPGPTPTPLVIPDFKAAAIWALRDRCGAVNPSIFERPVSIWNGPATVVSGELVDPACECRETLAAEIGADYIFRADPLLSSLHWLEPGGAMVRSSLSGYLYAAAQPARFLRGRVDGEEIAYGGQALKDGYAGFSVPMTISHSGGTITIQPSNQDDIWWQATEESTGEPIAFAVAPSQPVTGTVDFAAGTWSLTFSQTLAGAETAQVTLAGQVWAP